MKKFDSESAKDEFKNLCIEILPAIGSIEQELKKNGVTAAIRIGDNGYLSLDIHEKWRMVRYCDEMPIKISYEYSEELSVPNSISLNRVSENLVEISLVFASMQQELKNGTEIDSDTLKQEFVVWANEFEMMYGDVAWGTDDTNGMDYPDAIEKFAKEKIKKFGKMEGKVENERKNY